MDDSQLLHTIEKLVNEEHELMKQAEGGTLDEARHAHMREIEIQLDQCWDLLRQRRARRMAGLEPGDARLHDPDTTEYYAQ